MYKVTIYWMAMSETDDGEIEEFPYSYSFDFENEQDALLYFNQIKESGVSIGLESGRTVYLPITTIRQIAIGEVIP